MRNSIISFRIESSAMHFSLSWWQWFLAFAVYRVADWAKPFPGRRLEHLPGGWGIVLDDVVSALYMGALWFICLKFLPAWIGQ